MIEGPEISRGLVDEGGGEVNGYDGGRVDVAGRMGSVVAIKCLLLCCISPDVVCWRNGNQLATSEERSVTGTEPRDAF